MGNYDVFKYPTLVLKKIGIFSKTNSTRIKIVASVYMLTATYILVACTIQSFYVGSDVAAFTSNLEAIAGMLQIVVKFGAIGFRTNEFSKLIDYTTRFWKTDRCSSEVKAELDRILHRNIQFQKIVLSIIVVSTLLADLGVMFGLTLPSGTWKMEGQNLFYYTVLVAQTTCIPLSSFVIGAFDCLFLAFCTKAVVQFRILCCCIENIHSGKSSKFEENQYVEKIKFYLQHHIASLRFIENFRDLYSVPLLIQYTSSAFLICANMYAITENTSMKFQARLVTSVVAEILQLAFYCVPADYVTQEALEVSQSIYNSEWYLQQSPALKKVVTLGIQRSQQEITFRASGIIDFNARALVKVLRVSWSICAVMKRMKDI